MSFSVGGNLSAGPLDLGASVSVSPSGIDINASLGVGGIGGAGDVPSVILVLGDVPFMDFEVPEKISAGGQQATHVHKYPGGVRTIDTLGPDDSDITWSGWFEDGTAEQRCQQIDAMRRAGIGVTVTWSSYAYYVVVKAFEFRYNRFFHIAYDIRLQVIQDLMQAPPAEDEDADQSVSDDMDQTQSNTDQLTSGGTDGSGPGLPTPPPAYQPPQVGPDPVQDQGEPAAAAPVVSGVGGQPVFGTDPGELPVGGPL
jgi:hypothetical protein